MEYEGFPSGYECVYLNSANTLLAVNGRTRVTFYIMENSPEIIQGATATSNSNYDYSSQHCISSSDLLYRPEITDVGFTLASVLIFGLIIYILFSIFFRGWSQR